MPLLFLCAYLWSCFLHTTDSDTNKGDWFTFLDDIIPAGASRRYWVQRLDLAHVTTAEQNYELLKQATIAPVGHLRVKEAVESITEADNPPENQPRIFPLTDVINRDVDFLEYANEQGAVAGGATGAGGEAPKLLLRYREQLADKVQKTVWIDNLQHAERDDAYYLVKYPRGSRRQIDCDILRAEFHYYHELHEMGFHTIDTQHMQLMEGERYPSLWLPRFDIQTTGDGDIKRYAMESVYSLLRKGAGAYLNHEQCLRELITIIEQSQMTNDGFAFDASAFVIEWVQRDLLSIAFGNSDNHGRNTAFLRDKKRIQLAPIYNFAPMKADPEGIVRTMKWDKPLESGGQYRFDLIAQRLADVIEPAQLLAALNQTAQQFLSLHQRLAERGVPESILNFPNIGFKRLPDKLADWRML